MNAKTWIKEFYPVPAESVSKAKAGAHCLRKWLGLLPDSLKRHKIANPPITVNGGTCAYCTHYLRIDNSYECVECPLHNALGKDCDDDRVDISPYKNYVWKGDPLPMILALREAITWERKQKPKLNRKEN